MKRLAGSQARSTWEIKKMLIYADVTEHAKTTAKLGTALVGGLTGMLGFAVGQFVDQIVDPQSGIRKRARTIVDNSLDQRPLAARQDERVVGNECVSTCRSRW